MPTDPAVSDRSSPPRHGVGGAAAQCIVKRADGVFVDPSVSAQAFAAAVNGVFAANHYLAGLDYAVLLRLLYAVGPDLPRSSSGEAMVRLADAIEPFDPARRKLYRPVKLQHGVAEYYFEPVFLADADGGELPARLDVDEFVADLWTKGVRCGVDVAAVRQAIGAGKSERVTVARPIAPQPGRNAEIVEVSQDLHRSDAPRQLANGKLDLMAFQNRFPQIQTGARLLRKLPREAGLPGVDLAGKPIEPEPPEDVDLRRLCGPGTRIEVGADGEFLVAQQTGYLDVDPKTSQISIGDKVISRDGVSAKTTGNLQLTADYEEFGEVQEKRVIEGESITVHADVFGNIVSRGGAILLNRNLVGGSAHNERGDIRVKGVASNAVIQTRQGEVVLGRAESCVISGTRVVIEDAANCEIIADEVVIIHAQGCAVAGRRVTIESAGPRRQNEMVVHVLQPDSARMIEVIGLMEARVDQFRQAAAQRRAQLEALTNQPDVRRYVMLSSKIRKKELTLSAEQVPQFQKIAAAVGPSLKAIARLTEEAKAAETEQQAGEALIAQLLEQRSANAGVSSVAIAMLDGDTSVRRMLFQPDGSAIYDLPPKDIKQRLRQDANLHALIEAKGAGAFAWSSDQAVV